MLQHLRIRQNHRLACAAASALLGLTLFVPATLAQSPFGTILGTSTNEWFSTSAFVCPATPVSARSPAPAVPTSAPTAPDRFRLVSSFSKAPFAGASAAGPYLFARASPTAVSRGTALKGLSTRRVAPTWCFAPGGSARRTGTSGRALWIWRSAAAFT